MSGRIVIVGAGVAGATAAQTLRREGYTGEIVLIGAEHALPYRRPTVSKDLLAGVIALERALIKPAKFWADGVIDLRVATRVAELDAERGAVRLDTGEVLGYDSVLLATGARSRSVVTGSRRVHTLRGLADVAALRAAIVDGGSLLVIGGGLIGCEVAATARGLGAEVTVLEAGSALLQRIVPAGVSGVVADLHRGRGVRVELAVSATLADTADGVTATAADGRSWTAAAALFAIGAVPDTELAEAAGLAVNDGIVVDQHYRTSAPGVFAAGDVATGFDTLRGEFARGQHWNSAMSDGVAAARAILGHEASPAEVPWGWSDQYGVAMQFAGWVHPHDELVVTGDLAAHDGTVLALRDGRPVGAVSLGRPRDIRALRPVIAAGEPWAGGVPLESVPAR